MSDTSSFFLEFRSNEGMLKMKKKWLGLLGIKLILKVLLILFFTSDVFSQSSSPSEKYINMLPANFELFENDNPLSLTLRSDFQKLMSTMEEPEYEKAGMELELKKGIYYKSEVKIRVRGNTRKAVCEFPPLKLNLKKSELDETVKDLEKLDIVNTCRDKLTFIPMLYKEYLAYKIYNILSDYSYKVRLISPHYVDIQGIVEERTRPGFIIESDKGFENRTSSDEKKKSLTQGEIIQVFFGSSDDFHQTAITRLALFQYMIGNTDWGIQTRHNCKVYQIGLRYVPVPYDFDYSGLVNAPYAVPSKSYNLTSVKERYYQGPPVPEKIFTSESQRFLDKKEEIYGLVNNFSYLNEKEKAKIIKYFDSFYLELKEGGLKQKVVEKI